MMYLEFWMFYDKQNLLFDHSVLQDQTILIAFKLLTGRYNITKVIPKCTEWTDFVYDINVQLSFNVMWMETCDIFSKTNYTFNSNQHVQFCSTIKTMNICFALNKNHWVLEQSDKQINNEFNHDFVKASSVILLQCTFLGKSRCNKDILIIMVLAKSTLDSLHFQYVWQICFEGSACQKGHHPPTECA